jgi:phage-related protein
MKAGQAAKQFIADSIGGASDLNESTTKTEAVFGSATDTIMKFASGAATAIGQSKQEALDAASTFGIYGRSAGLSGQALADFAMTQTALASDLASFYNTSPQDAIVALGAAFRGQAEPARAFGVLMDDMSMRAAAFKMGIISSTKEALTPQNKVLAANALIMEQTKVAQGDFAKTSAGLANQQRILAAQLANTKTQFGQALLPTVLSVVAAFNTKVLPAFTGLAGSFKTLISEISSRLAPTFENLKTIIGNIVTAVAPLAQIVGGLLAIGFVTVTNTLNVLLPIVSAITGFFAQNKAILIAVATAVGLVTAAVVGATIAFKIQTAVVKGVTAVMKLFQVMQLILRGGQLATIASTNGLAASMLALNATLSANPIGAVIAVIALLVAAFVLAWKKSETFRNIVAKTFEVVSKVVLFAVKAMIGYVRMFVNSWMNVAGFVLDGAAKMFGWIPGIGGKIKGAAKAFDGLQTDVNGTFDKITNGAEQMQKKVAFAVNAAAKAGGDKKTR